MVDFFCEHHCKENIAKDIEDGRVGILVVDDGKLELVEKWQWLNGDKSEGESVVVERFLR